MGLGQLLVSEKTCSPTSALGGMPRTHRSQLKELLQQSRQMSKN